MSRGWTLAGVGLLVLLTTVAYVPSLRGGFIVDDDLLLTDSRLIKAPNGLHAFWLSTEAVDYWPVSNTSLWLEWRAWGAHPTGYHVTNLVLHVIDALLIWAILRRLAIPAAYLAALLFALHPINVQAVAWITQRKTLLAMLFSLLSVLAFFESEARLSRSRRSTVFSFWYWLALVLFAAAMLSKISAAIVAPLLLVVLAWAQPLRRRDLVLTLPYFMLAIVLAAVNLWFRTHRGGVAQPVGAIGERIPTAASSIWLYLYKALVPIDLAYMYPRWDCPVDRLQSWLPLLALLIVTALVWRYRRHWGRGIFFAWVFYCLALVPALGLTEKLVLADRYQHVALIALMALIAAGWESWRQRAGHVARVLLCGAAGLVIGMYAALTWRQSTLYSDNVTLMQTAVEAYPESALAHHNLGFALLKAGRLQEAQQHLAYALQVEPDYVDAHNILAATLTEAGRPSEAIAHFEAVLRLDPDAAKANYNLGAALREAGRPQDAIGHLQRAIQLQPRWAAPHRELGKALLTLGRRQEATAELEQALRLDPDDQDAGRQLATASSAVNQAQENRK